jgi:hypothetical protein
MISANLNVSYTTYKKYIVYNINTALINKMNIIDPCLMPFFFSLCLLLETISCYIVQAGLELPALLPQTSECWDYRLALPFCSGYFGGRGLANYLPRLALNCDPPDLSLPSS